MTTRTDVSVDFHESPRIIEIAAPSTEMGMQDLVDTVRKIEDSFSQGMAFEKLLDASGKEDLGGGVLVGITVDLDNAQLSFEPRRTAAAVGSVTTGSGTPIQGPLGPTYNFVDTGADFVSAGISRGSLAINFTDHSVADVIEVISPTELRTRVLVNGSDNTWQVGDDYHIFNIIQCNASGGNLVSRDDVGNRITSVFPTAFVQVVRTASSSATLQEQADIQYASFNGGITVDVTSLYSGTIYPTGTPRQPVNNLDDAVAMATERGFTTLYIIGDIELDSAIPSLEGFTLIGESANKTTIIIDPDAQVQRSEFSSATIQGTLDGGNVVSECVINELNFVDGFVTQCVLNGLITLSTQDNAHFLDCWSGVPGSQTPTIDFEGAGSGLAMRNYNGGITLRNKTGSEPVSLDLNSGQIILEDTVTTGEIILRGIGRWTNETTYTGGADVKNQLIDPFDVQATAFGGQVTIDVTSSYSGTVFPVGTARMPVNNLADAKAIAERQGYHHLYIVGNITFATGDDISGYTVRGQNAASTVITVEDGAAATNTEFQECLITGTLDSGNIVRNSIIWNVSHFDGILFQTMLRGIITLGGNAVMLSSYSSGTSEATAPIIDFGGSGTTLLMREYSGAIKLTNKSGTEESGLDIQGSIIIDDSVNAGTITIRGVGSWLNKDTYSGNANIINELSTDAIPAAVVNELNVQTYDGEDFGDIMADLLAMAKGKIVESPAGTFTFYEQDDTTPRFVLVKSGNTRTRT